MILISPRIQSFNAFMNDFKIRNAKFEQLKLIRNSKIFAYYTYQNLDAEINWLIYIFIYSKRTNTWYFKDVMTYLSI